MLLSFVALSLTVKGCIEPFEAETISFESALVIDATITDELKTQVIILSRSFAFEEDGPAAERNAAVVVEGGQGNTYPFIESGPGIYESEQPFAAQPGTSYQLHITANNGRKYASVPTSLSPAADLQSVYAERTTNGNGVEGVAIRVDAGSASGNSRNYRYTFEETYKIVAPDWFSDELVPDPEGGCGVLVQPRKNEEQTCYATDASNSLILTDTNSFGEDKVSGFIVRFINRNNAIISYRYSILVHQYVQSDAAYTFFETLNEFSGAESLFSETQPGFLEGNVFSEDNVGEKVLGYFDVSPVREQRIFFNYDDLFPGEPLPPYFDPCNRSTPPLTAGLPPRCVLRGQIEANIISLLGDNQSPASTEGPYIVVPRICGDCTTIGSKDVPGFWTEE